MRVSGYVLAALGLGVGVAFLAQRGPKGKQRCPAALDSMTTQGVGMTTIVPAESLARAESLLETDGVAPQVGRSADVINHLVDSVFGRGGAQLLLSVAMDTNVSRVSGRPTLALRMDAGILLASRSGGIDAVDQGVALVSHGMMEERRASWARIGQMLVLLNALGNVKGDVRAGLPGARYAFCQLARMAPPLMPNDIRRSIGGKILVSLERRDRV